MSVKVAGLELSFPPSIDFEQAKGFGIYLVKAMLNHRGQDKTERSFSGGRPRPEALALDAMALANPT